MADQHRVVIVGGGFGGLYAALSLRDAPAQITLVDRRNFHLFQPLLYQVATGTLSVGNIAASLRVTLRKHKNTQVLLGEMVGIDPERKLIQLRDGALPYDTVVIAAGSENYYIGHDEWRESAPGLKTVEDAITMRSRIFRAFEAAERAPDPRLVKEWLTFLIVGAGPTGVELAGALAEIAHRTLRDDFRDVRPESARIILINGHGRVLPEYAPELSVKAERALRRLGVIIRNNCLVTELEPGGLIVDEQGRSEYITSRTVLWAAGVRASPLGRVIAQATGAELDKQGRIRVGPDLSIPGHPEILVIGDLAEVQGPDGPLPGVATVAMQEGRYVAELIQHRLRNKPMPAFRFRPRGSLATIGRGKAVADIWGWKFNGFLAWLAWAVVHLLYIIEFEDRLLVMMQWFWHYLTWNRSDMLITYTRSETTHTAPLGAEEKTPSEVRR
jgi:NADH dehydrogenase